MEAYSPAASYILSLKKREDTKLYNKWFNGLYEYHIESFVAFGLKPFLTKFGYTLGFSDKKMIQYCKLWAGNIAINNNKKFILWAHNGGTNEFDWFSYNISIDDWYTLCDTWKDCEFLDDSDAGFKQALDLQSFIWQCISLEASKQHRRWLDINTDLEEEDHWIHDENHAYGGDRRTY